MFRYRVKLFGSTLFDVWADDFVTNDGYIDFVIHTTAGDNSGEVMTDVIVRIGESIITSIEKVR